MKLSAAFAILIDLRIAILAAFMPTLRQICSSPGLLLHPGRISQFFMAHVWTAFADGVDENGGSTKRSLITPNAHGVVLDIGAGYGHTMNYLDRQKVTKYIALEPNTYMHERIRVVAAKAGYSELDGTLAILSCGAEDAHNFLETPADTIVAVLTLCTIPNPESTIRSLALDALKPGGVFLFYEHVLSDRKDVQWWQRFWTPLWSKAFDGCQLDRPSHHMVQSVGVWKEGNSWDKEDEDPEHLFVHKIGKFVKSL